MNELQVSGQIIHIAGTRMIGQGSNGLSRGSFYEKFINGKPMLLFLLLGELVLKRLEQLVR